MSPTPNNDLRSVRGLKDGQTVPQWMLRITEGGKVRYVYCHSQKGTAEAVESLKQEAVRDGVTYLILIIMAECPSRTLTPTDFPEPCPS